MKKWILFALLATSLIFFIFHKYILGSSTLQAGMYKVRDKDISGVTSVEIWTGDPDTGIGRFREKAEIVKINEELLISIPNPYSGSFKEVAIFGWVISRSDLGPFLKLTNKSEVFFVPLHHLCLVAPARPIEQKIDRKITNTSEIEAKNVSDIESERAKILALNVQTLRSSGKTKEQISKELGISIQIVETIFKELGP